MLSSLGMDEGYKGTELNHVAESTHGREKKWIPWRKRARRTSSARHELMVGNGEGASTDENAHEGCPTLISEG